MIQGLGITQSSFEMSSTAILAFKSAVVSTMTGVTTDSIYINSVKTLTAKRRKLANDDDATTASPTYAPVEVPTNLPTPLPIYTLSDDDDDNTPSPIPDPTLAPTDSPTIDRTGEATGILINYNITVSAKALGFDSPMAAFDALTSELITAIDNGNFTQALQTEAAMEQVDMLLSASSSITDFAIKSYMAILSGGGRRTVYPSSSPTFEPSTPSRMYGGSYLRVRYHDKAGAKMNQYIKKLKQPPQPARVAVAKKDDSFTAYIASLKNYSSTQTAKVEDIEDRSVYEQSVKSSSESLGSSNSRGGGGSFVNVFNEFSLQSNAQNGKNILASKIEDVNFIDTHAALKYGNVSDREKDYLSK